MDPIYYIMDVEFIPKKTDKLLHEARSLAHNAQQFDVSMES